MLDPRRAALLASMGISEWQLRHPELLALQGQLPVLEAEPLQAQPQHTGPQTAQGVLPGLWYRGERPVWLTDMARLLGLAERDCHAVSDELWQSPNAVAVLLLLEAAEEGTLAASLQLDGRAGKRALWQQICASGWLKVSDDEFN